MDHTATTDREVMAEVGRRLRSLRKARRVAMIDAAAAAGLSRRTVHRAETGDNPTLMQAIADGYLRGTEGRALYFADAGTTKPTDGFTDLLATFKEHAPEVVKFEARAEATNGQLAEAWKSLRIGFALHASDLKGVPPEQYDIVLCLRADWP